MSKKKLDNNHYRQFASCLEDIIAGYTEGSEDLEHAVRQKAQVETLCALEREFRETLIRDRRGPSVYRAFLRYVRDERRNILAARPYFRERQDVFKAKIAPALRERQDKSLYQFGINYPFISFCLKAGKFPPGSRVARLATKVKTARAELIEMNIPLAISRARVFARYKQAHLEYMDLVQIATEGLIAAVDKYVLPYRKSYGAVLYGRITGDLVEGNSETLVHFYPSDKRLIYTANKMVKNGNTFDQIADHIMVEAQAKGKTISTNGEELQQLHIAAYTISGDSSGPSQDDETKGAESSPIHRFEADESWRPDVQYEQSQLMSALKNSISELTPFERKLLALKGVTL